MLKSLKQCKYKLNRCTQKNVADRSKFKGSMTKWHVQKHGQHNKRRNLRSTRPDRKILNQILVITNRHAYDKIELKLN